MRTENTYDIEIQNGMTYIHDNKVNKISECNLIHYTINPPKHTKHLNDHYSPIIHGCMNTRKGKANFSNFRILLNIGCSYSIVFVRIVKTLNHKKHAAVQFQTQAGNITTNPKVKLDLTLPALSATNVVAWKCHVDDSAKVRYDMILGDIY